MASHEQGLVHLEEGQEGSPQKGCICFSGARVTGNYQMSTYVAVGPRMLNQESRREQETVRRVRRLQMA